MRKITKLPIIFTLVRHSAWTVAGKPAFQNAVETRLLTSEKEIEKVKKVGGLLIEGKEAYDKEYQINYPEHVKGIFPDAQGKFSRAKLDGQEIYIP